MAAALPADNEICSLCKQYATKFCICNLNGVYFCDRCFINHPKMYSENVHMPLPISEHRNAQDPQYRQLLFKKDEMKRQIQALNSYKSNFAQKADDFQEEVKLYKGKVEEAIDKLRGDLEAYVHIGIEEAKLKFESPQKYRGRNPVARELNQPQGAPRLITCVTDFDKLFEQASSSLNQTKLKFKLTCPDLHAAFPYKGDVELVEPVKTQGKCRKVLGWLMEFLLLLVVVGVFSPHIKIHVRLFSGCLFTAWICRKSSWGVMIWKLFLICSLIAIYSELRLSLLVHGVTNLENGGKFVGPLVLPFRPIGQGYMIGSNRLNEGCFDSILRCGKIEGLSSAIYGMWDDFGTFNGYGAIIQKAPRNVTMIGKFYDGKLEGFGAVLDEEDMEVGFFKEGKLSGKAVIARKNGVYFGDFRNGEKEGYGAEYTKPTYEGKWKGGEQSK